MVNAAGRKTEDSQLALQVGDLYNLRGAWGGKVPMPRTDSPGPFSSCSFLRVPLLRVAMCGEVTPLPVVPRKCSAKPPELSQPNFPRCSMYLGCNRPWRSGDVSSCFMLASRRDFLSLRLVSNLFSSEVCGRGGQRWLASSTTGEHAVDDRCEWGVLSSHAYGEIIL